MLTASMRAELPRVRAGNASERLIALGVGYVKFATSSPAYLSVIFGGVLAGDAVSPELGAAGQEAYLTLRQEVAGGIGRGELKAGDPDQVALACWSLVHGLSTLLINGAVPAPPSHAAERALVATLLRMLCNGIEA
jgi:hypothetical protein